MFLNSQNPTLVFDQSLARHVGLDFPNMRSPSSISLTMIVFYSWKRHSRSSFHLKGVPGFNGCSRSSMLNSKDTWLRSPNQERMSVMFQGNSIMACRYFLHGLTLSHVISNPANSTVSCAKTNFSGLSVIPCRPHISSHSPAWKQNCLLYCWPT